MRALATAAALIGLVACGGTGTGIAPNPTPPTNALAAWSNFPADRNPRPILLLERPPLYTGFTSGDGKIAAYCNKYRLAFEQPSTAPTQASVTWADGARATYPAISAVDAYNAIAGAPTEMQRPDCASVQALDVTAARLGTAGFQTDRGTAQMSAWLLTVTGSTGDISYPAVAPSAFWAGSFVSGLGGGGATVSADGLTLKYGFVGGSCDAGYRSAVAESTSAVAVTVVAIPNSPQGPCDLMGHARSITVALASPLGGRVLVDQSGKVEPACPPGLTTC